MRMFFVILVLAMGFVCFTPQANAQNYGRAYEQAERFAYGELRQYNDRCYISGRLRRPVDITHCDSYRRTVGRVDDQGVVEGQYCRSTQGRGIAGCRQQGRAVGLVPQQDPRMRPMPQQGRRPQGNIIRDLTGLVRAIDDFDDDDRRRSGYRGQPPQHRHDPHCGHRRRR